jgi:hypothetical protein
VFDEAALKQKVKVRAALTLKVSVKKVVHQSKRQIDST